jgi:hypothetical protein
MRKCRFHASGLPCFQDRDHVGLLESIDRPNNIGRSDHRHTPREDRCGSGTSIAEGVHAEVGVPGSVAVSERDGACFPTAAIVAAPERAHGVQELVMRVGCPVRGFASAGDDDTGAVLGPVFPDGNGGGEMHDTRDRA